MAKKKFKDDVVVSLTASQLKTSRNRKRRMYLVRFKEDQLFILNQKAIDIFKALSEVGEATAKELSEALIIKEDVCRLILIMLFKNDMIKREMRRDGSTVTASYWVEEQFVIYEPTFVA